MAGDSGPVQLPPSPAASPNQRGKGGGSALSQPSGNWAFGQVPGRPSTPERFVCRCLPPRTPVPEVVDVDSIVDVDSSTNTAMPGPQTQHNGTVCGDDENAPKPGLGPPVRRRPQHAHRQTSCSHPVPQHNSPHVLRNCSSAHNQFLSTHLHMYRTSSYIHLHTCAPAPTRPDPNNHTLPIIDQSPRAPAGHPRPFYPSPHPVHTSPHPAPFHHDSMHVGADPEPVPLLPRQPQTATRAPLSVQPCPPNPPIPDPLSVTQLVASPTPPSMAARRSPESSLLRARHLGSVPYHGSRSRGLRHGRRPSPLPHPPPLGSS